ncbi:MAG: DNA/RNA non-specific endonuclease [Spirochaetia bacterium]
MNRPVLFKKYPIAMILALLIAIIGYFFDAHTAKPSGLELPTPVQGDHQVVHGDGYSLQYSEAHEQALWVAYTLTHKSVLGTAKRKDNFRTDPRIKTGSASPEDYTNSGYDRGHLAPAADMKASQKMMDESFYMSNISPQIPAFNRGVWAKLEAWARTQTSENTPLYIVTGPILDAEKTYKTIGSNTVAVPEYFYKVILRTIDGQYSGIAYILPNQAQDHFEFFATSINEVERRTGIDFFPGLPDDIEEIIEDQSH